MNMDNDIFKKVTQTTPDEISVTFNICLFIFGISGFLNIVKNFIII